MRLSAAFVLALFAAHNAMANPTAPATCFARREASIQLQLDIRNADPHELRIALDKENDLIVKTAAGDGTRAFPGGMFYSVTTDFRIPPRGEMSDGLIPFNSLPQEKEGSYHLTGVVNYLVTPYAKAYPLEEKLLARHIPVRLNLVLSSGRGECRFPADESAPPAAPPGPFDFCMSAACRAATCIPAQIMDIVTPFTALTHDGDAVPQILAGKVMDMLPYAIAAHLSALNLQSAAYGFEPVEEANSQSYKASGNLFILAEPLANNAEFLRVLHEHGLEAKLEYYNVCTPPQ